MVRTRSGVRSRRTRPRAATRRTTGVEQRRLAAIMFADVVGYVALTQEDESTALKLLQGIGLLLRPICARHGGRLVKTIGDGFLVEFGSALEAARCAVNIQQSLQEHNATQPENDRVWVRIGIHVGDVVYRRRDIFGDAVNIAARIEPLAESGGICMSQQVFDQVRDKINAPIEKLGLRELKNLRLPLEVYRVVLPKEREMLKEITSEVEHRTAVLPLTNISPDPKDEYFADGMTEELIATLSKISDLRVIARTSVMKYKGAGKSIQEIGRELKVGTLLEGSVRKADSKLRITVQLIDVKNEEHLWSQLYDRELQDVFSVQSDIAQRVAEALKLRLIAGERSQIEKKATANLGAHDCYLLGRYSWNKRTEDDIKEAIGCFETAIKEDPDYALAYAGLADCYSVGASYDYFSPKEAYPKAREAAMKALEIDSTLAEAHASLASVKQYYDWDWSGAEIEYKRAIELNPSYATAHHWYALCLLFMGRLDEALAEIKRAQELDPLSLIIGSAKAYVFYLRREYDRAMEQCRKTLEMDQNFWGAHFGLGFHNVQRRMYEEAIKAFQRAEALSGGTLEIVAWLGYTYAVSGNRAEATKILEDLKELSRQKYVPPYHLGLIHFGLAEKDKASEYLEKAYEERYSWLPLYLRLDPVFDSLRSDTRFTELLKKMGLEK